jgi:hypothetical protein
VQPQQNLYWFVPLENVQFALIWPVFPTRHQTRLDRIFHNIQSLLVITFTTAKLPVKKILLPNGLVTGARPTARCLSTPEFHPPFERRHRNTKRSTEQVDMIRHNNMTPHQPVVGFAPRFDEQLMDFRIRQQRTAAIHVTTHILNDCLIWQFQRRQMRQLFSSGFIHDYQRDDYTSP